MHNRRRQLCEEHRCADIHRCPQEFWDGPRWHYSLQHADEYSPHTCGAIRATVSRIEYDIDKKAQAKWRELYPDTEPAGLFVAKVVMSEIPMDELQSSLPAFERLLLAHGYGIYCIDYTQDFFGVFRPGGARGPPMRF